MEKDDEVAGSGNSYTAEFWQYDSRLGRRWNLDPKPNFSISSYAVLGLNPIINIDPFGDTLKISHKGNDFIYDKGDLYTIDAQGKQSLYTGQFAKQDKNGVKKDANGKVIYKGFLGEATEALRTLENGSVTAQSMIKDLQSKGYAYTIQKGENQFIENSPTSATIEWDPSAIGVGMNMDGTTNSPGFISLAHEMGHGWDHYKGTFSARIIGHAAGVPVTNSERFATFTENLVRRDFKLSLRTHYGTEQDINSMTKLPIPDSYHGVFKVFDVKMMKHIKVSFFNRFNNTTQTQYYGEQF